MVKKEIINSFQVFIWSRISCLSCWHLWISMVVICA